MGCVPSLILAVTGCCGLSPLLSSDPLKMTGPSCDPVPSSSESPTELCSTARCALYPSSKGSVSTPGMSVQCAPSARPWPGGQGVLVRERSGGETGALHEMEESGAEGSSPWVHRACCE